MPNTTCLFGPAFSLSGNLYFSDTDVNFQVTFNNEADAAGILIYEWYLDDNLLITQSNRDFIGKVNCGAHTLGVRILSGDGWSGIKNLEFTTCKAPKSLLLYGPDVIDEGTSAPFYLLQLYTDGSTEDLTTQYTFTSTEGGAFIGNIFTADVDDTEYDAIQVTISAIKEGMEPMTKHVTINNTTPIVLVSLGIIGPNMVDEGTSASYTVIAVYSNGAQQDLTAEYAFTCTVGSFTVNILTVPLDGIGGNDRPAIIQASKGSSSQLSKQISIRDKAPIEVSDFDFMAVRYHWVRGAGRDLDILVGYENNGTPSDYKYVGFGQSNSTVPPGTRPQADAYLWWAADNKGDEGYECVLVGIKKFITAFPTSPNIVEVGLYAVWYRAPISGNFTVEVVTYKGGTMNIQGNNFVNVGGVQVSSNTITVNTLITNGQHTPETSYKVGRLRYNKTTQSATIEIN